MVYVHVSGYMRTYDAKGPPVSPAEEKSLAFKGKVLFAGGMQDDALPADLVELDAPPLLQRRVSVVFHENQLLNELFDPRLRAGGKASQLVLALEELQPSAVRIQKSVEPAAQWLRRALFAVILYHLGRGLELGMESAYEPTITPLMSRVWAVTERCRLAVGNAKAKLGEEYKHFVNGVMERLGLLRSLNPAAPTASPLENGDAATPVIILDTL